MSNIKFDFRGHFHDHNEYLEKGLKRDLKSFEILKDPIFLPKETCYICGEKVRFSLNDKTLTADSNCKYPNGYPDIEFTINVPSGQIVYGNDFRDQFQLIGDWYVNYTSEVARCIQDYAAINFAHCHVGNTCPGIYKINGRNDKFWVGTKGENKRNAITNSKCIGGFCTDLWWTSMADYNDFIARGGNVNTETFKCKPGVYKFTHRYHKSNGDGLFTTIEWIREPDEWIDHQAAYEALNFTAGQVFNSYFKDKQDFYGSPTDGYIKNSYAESVSKAQGCVNKKEWPYYFAASRLLCVLGNGLEWHKNGWCSTGVMPNKDCVDIEIPIFTKAYHWYPLSDSSGIGEMVSTSRTGIEQDANPSFVKLGFNILQAIIRYGVYERPVKGGEPVINKTGHQIKTAKKLYKLMVEKYGEPDFCQGLYQQVCN